MKKPYENYTSLGDRLHWDLDISDFSDEPSAAQRCFERLRFGREPDFPDFSHIYAEGTDAEGTDAEGLVIHLFRHLHLLLAPTLGS